ncbi:MAG: ribosome small subunit-dependent GTPase A [Negativicutes bacterium]|nr:ribosome small subunit-dependent GTPase A [Negativicutes bacterium]
MTEAVVIKRVGGLYQMLDRQGNRYRGSSRGKHKEQGILIGDLVEIQTEGGKSMIEKVLPRRNELDRPSLANVDQLILVFAYSQPALQRELLDKMLLQAEIHHIVPIIVLQKSDLSDREEVDRMMADYALAGYTILQTSALQQIGIAELRRLLQGKISVFAGPSGVGKSSLLNCLYPNWKLETGAISQKSQRGKHTTRHAELYGRPEDGLIADTPGFYHLDLPLVEPRLLADYFPEMRPALGQCRFISCVHDKEPDCAVKQLLAEGKIAAARYAAYLKFLTEMKDRERGLYS